MKSIEIKQEEGTNFITINGVKYVREEEPQLIKGKWSFVDRCFKSEQRALVLYNGNDKPAFGFTHAGNWSDDYVNKEDTFINPTYKYALATESEVKEALKKEAVKRYKNSYIEPLNRHLFNRDDESVNCIHLFDEKSLYINSKEIWINYGKYFATIYENGKWAEIIPTITKEESEKQLGKKIID